MATPEDVRRVALSLPETVEADGEFVFSVVDAKGKRHGFVWAWNERVEPKKPRVPREDVLALRVIDEEDKQALLASDPDAFFTEPHYNGFPAVLVRLPVIGTEASRSSSWTPGGPALHGRWSRRTRAARPAAGPGPRLDPEEEPMIARTWRGWTARADADEYVEYLRRTGIEEYRATPGNRAAYILRRNDGDRTEFVTLTFWDSMEAVAGFAGSDVEQAVFYPEDVRFLVERETTTSHYEVVETPEPG